MDMQKLLGQFLGAGGGMGQRGGQRQPHEGRGSLGGLGQGGGSIVDQVGGLLGGRGGSALTGALVGGLASQLFKGKGVSKLGGSALKLGGAAIVAGLAYKAYQSYQANNRGPALPGAQPTPALASAPATEVPEAHGTAFLPAGEEDARAKLMLSAMIAAAKADGYIDAEEEEAIFGRIDEIGLDAEEKGFVMDEMRRPITIEALAAKATTPEIAMEIYTASVLSIDADHPAEKAYLDRLAQALRLPPELAHEIHATAGAVQG